MKNNIKLSVIIPVYNVENYVEECILSVLNQSVNDMEVIVVDNGSTDNSMKKIKGINDKRVKVYSIEQCGVGAARNYGLRVSNGKYVAFMDSDDFLINKNAYHDMINRLEKSNEVFITAKAKYYYEDGTFKSMEKNNNNIFKNKQLTSKEYLLESIKSNRIYVVVWLSIYNRSFLIDNNLFFKEGILHEDELFTNKLLLKLDNILLFDEEIYGYRQRKGSIMNQMNEKRINDIYYVCLELNKEFKSIKDDELRKCMINYISESAFNVSKNRKVKNIPNEIKKLILTGLNDSKKLKEAKLLCFNERLYYFFIKVIYRVRIIIKRR